MSLFRIIKYSSIIFFLDKYKSKLFRVAAVLLFAWVTSLLYQDMVDYLQLQHPGTLIYALFGKILIVYGALIFVLWQFRPSPEVSSNTVLKPDPSDNTLPGIQNGVTPPDDRLSALENLVENPVLGTRYDHLLREKGEAQD
ncbi:MAG: hypothetical protein HOC23_10955 [Halieaceae bacterium]|jgi:hypothetical protein|nr:hypothetical protein [Halieaceae bacterium]